MKKVFASIVLSLLVFLMTICIFQLFEPGIKILLIYPLASSVLCTLLVFGITSSAIASCTSLLLNNIFLIFVLIPLSGGPAYYHEILRSVLLSGANHDLINYVWLFAAVSLAIGILTIKIYKLLKSQRSRDVFISSRAMRREFFGRY
ncbi:MAG: hypothetical protein K6T80_08505 [Firmicutes bacterium]|nr:hypothetical protein [Bacillota bacterium]